jgi:hypothetical protein
MSPVRPVLLEKWETRSLSPVLWFFRLETLLLEGLAGGDDIPVTPEFWKDLKAGARNIAAKHKARKRP